MPESHHRCEPAADVDSVVTVQGVFQQPKQFGQYRTLPRGDEGRRAWHAEVQINEASLAIRDSPCGPSQSIQSRQAPNQS